MSLCFIKLYAVLVEYDECSNLNQKLKNLLCFKGHRNTTRQIC